MQISNKGCGVIISLLNGLFWYNSTFALFPACILPKKWGLTSTVVPVSCALPCSHSLGAADLQRTYFAFWNENYLFGYVILKILFHLEYIVRLLALKWEHEVSLCGCPAGRCCTRMVYGYPVTPGHIWWPAGRRGIPEQKCCRHGACGHWAQLCAAHSCAHTQLIWSCRVLCSNWLWWMWLVHWRLSKIQPYGVRVYTVLAA